MAEPLARTLIDRLEAPLAAQLRTARELAGDRRPEPAPWGAAPLRTVKPSMTTSWVFSMVITEPPPPPSMMVAPSPSLPIRLTGRVMVRRSA